MALLDEFLVSWKVVTNAQALKGLEGKLKGFQKRTQKISLAAGAGIGAAIGTGIRDSIEIEKAAALVETLGVGPIKPEVEIGVTTPNPADIEETISAQARAIIRGYKLEEEEGLAAFYSTVSSSVAGNPLDLLDVAIRSSVGGMVTMDEAVMGMASTLNAYNMEASKAGYVSDIMHEAVAAGNTTFQKMGKELSTVTGIAAVMKIPLEQAAGAVVSLTLKGIETNKAATAVRAAMVALQNPTKQLGEYFESVGYASGQAAIDALGFQGAMELVRKAEIATGLSGKTLLSTDEAATAYFALTGDNAEKARANIERLNNASGKTDENFEKISATAYHSLRQASASFTSTKAALVKDLIPAITWLGQVFANMPSSVFIATAGVLGFLALLSPVAGGIIALIKLFRVLQTAILFLNSGTLMLRLQLLALSAQTMVMAIAAKAVAAGKAIWTAAQWALNVAMMANPIGLVIAGIVALIAVVIAVIKYWDNITAAVKSAWQWLGKMRDAVAGVQTPIGKLGSILKWLFLPIYVLISSIKLLVRHWDSIIGVIKRVIGFIADIDLGALGANLILSFIAGIASVKDAVWNAIKSAFSFITDLDFTEYGRRLLQTFLDGILGMKDALVDGVKGVLSSVRDFLPFSDAKRGPLSDISNSGAAMVTTFSDGMEHEARRMQPTLARTAGVLGEGVNAGVEVGDALTKLSDVKIPPVGIDPLTVNAGVEVGDALTKLSDVKIPPVGIDPLTVNAGVEVGDALTKLSDVKIPPVGIDPLTVNAGVEVGDALTKLSDVKIPPVGIDPLTVNAGVEVGDALTKLSDVKIPPVGIDPLTVNAGVEVGDALTKLSDVKIPPVGIDPLTVNAGVEVGDALTKLRDVKIPPMGIDPLTVDAGDGNTLQSILVKLNIRLGDLQTAISELTASLRKERGDESFQSGSGIVTNVYADADRKVPIAVPKAVTPPPADQVVNAVRSAVSDIPGGDTTNVYADADRKVPIAVPKAVTPPPEGEILNGLREVVDGIEVRIPVATPQEIPAPDGFEATKLQTTIADAFNHINPFRDNQPRIPVAEPRKVEFPTGEILDGLRDTVASVDNNITVAAPIAVPFPEGNVVSGIKSAVTDIETRAPVAMPQSISPPAGEILNGLRDTVAEIRNNLPVAEPRKVEFPIGEVLNGIYSELEIGEIRSAISELSDTFTTNPDILKQLPPHLAHVLGPTLQRVAEPTTFQVPAPVPQSAVQGGNTRNVSVGEIAINITPTSEAAPIDIARAVRREMEEAFRTVAEDNSTVVLR